MNYWVNFLLDTPTEQIEQWGELIFAGDDALASGNFAEAERCFNEALRYAENNWGKDCLNAVPPLFSLSNVYRMQGLMLLAESTEREGVRICDLDRE